MTDRPADRLRLWLDRPHKGGLNEAATSELRRLIGDVLATNDRIMEAWMKSLRRNAELRRCISMPEVRDSIIRDSAALHESMADWFDTLKWAAETDQQAKRAEATAELCRSMAERLRSGDA